MPRRKVQRTPRSSDRHDSHNGDNSCCWKLYEIDPCQRCASFVQERVAYSSTEMSKIASPKWETEWQPDAALQLAEDVDAVQV